MRIHFIGIGGIGVSALARYYLEKGHQVSGSDLFSSKITDALKKLGAKISIGPHNFPKWSIGKRPDLIIYSPAVHLDNPELKKAKELKIKYLSYPQALGELTKEYFTIAVSGTHGKSTTTAMIGLLLIKAGLDPTIIVGTKLKEFGSRQNDEKGSNCRVGKSQYLVIEADENFASFLNYWPKIIVLTNIEKEHLDYYKNLRNILKTYKEYISHLPKDGVLIANKDDKNIKKVISKSLKNVIYYSLKNKESIKLKRILKIPGQHNISNALAALNVARVLKISDKVSFKALSEYKGSWRRFEEKSCSLKRSRKLINEKKEKIIKFKIISDYGHHPTEIKATLKAAREKYPKKQIWLIYQPHQCQRTYYLFDDFVKVFREAPIDKLIITDIYDVAGRENEKIKKKVSSVKLTNSILLQKNKLSNKEVIYISNSRGPNKFIKIFDYLKKNLKGGEVIIIMGAGDVDKLIIYLTPQGAWS